MIKLDKNKIPFGNMIPHNIIDNGGVIKIKTPDVKVMILDMIAMINKASTNKKAHILIVADNHDINNLTMFPYNGELEVVRLKGKNNNDVDVLLNKAQNVPEGVLFTTPENIILALKSIKKTNDVVAIIDLYSNHHPHQNAHIKDIGKVLNLYNLYYFIMDDINFIIKNGYYVDSTPKVDNMIDVENTFGVMKLVNGTYTLTIDGDIILADTMVKDRVDDNILSKKHNKLIYDNPICKPIDPTRLGEAAYLTELGLDLDGDIALDKDNATFLFIDYSTNTVKPIRKQDVDNKPDEPVTIRVKELSNRSTTDMKEKISLNKNTGSIKCEINKTMKLQHDSKSDIFNKLALHDPSVCIDMDFVKLRYMGYDISAEARTNIIDYMINNVPFPSNNLTTDMLIEYIEKDGSFRKNLIQTSNDIINTEALEIIYAVCHKDNVKIKIVDTLDNSYEPGYIKIHKDRLVVPFKHLLQYSRYYDIQSCLSVISPNLFICEVCSDEY